MTNQEIIDELISKNAAQAAKIAALEALIGTISFIADGDHYESAFDMAVDIREVIRLEKLYGG